MVVTEGDGGTQSAVFTARLSSAASSTVTVGYATANGSAGSPADFAAKAGTLSFSPGQTSKTVPVTVKADVLGEPDETFSLNLSNASGATIADATGLGTIRDNDSAPSIAVGDVTVAEGDGGNQTVVFTIRLSSAASETVRVAYTLAAGSASSPNDFNAASGTLSFSPGQTSKTVSVTVKADVLDEPDETFSLNLSNPSGATIADATGIGTIRDND